MIEVVTVIEGAVIEFIKPICYKNEELPLGQWAHETKLDIISHLGNVHQNHNEVPFHSHKHDFNKKTHTITSIGEAMEKLEASYMGVGNVKWCSNFGK